ncbi:hypothetical protein EZS27_010386 [termite gut metagenome]|uniref:BACON domain-containing protein n=1 Tax=termite gut metagenome TaxID=433724 RepID=A0A5J4S819_9ZZZZ
MNNLFKYLIVFFFVGIFFSCKDDKYERAFLEITELQLFFEQAGGDKFVTVSTNQTFEATSNQTWCVPSVVTGKATDNLKVSATKNDASGQRIAEITVTAEGLTSVKVTVTQSGSEAAIVLVLPDRVTTGNDSPKTGAKTYHFATAWGNYAGETKVIPVDKTLAGELSATAMQAQTSFPEQLYYFGSATPVNWGEHGFGAISPTGTGIYSSIINLKNGNFLFTEVSRWEELRTRPVTDSTVVSAATVHDILIYVCQNEGAADFPAEVAPYQVTINLNTMEVSFEQANTYPATINFAGECFGPVPEGMWDPTQISIPHKGNGLYEGTIEIVRAGGIRMMAGPDWNHQFQPLINWPLLSDPANNRTFIYPKRVEGDATGWLVYAADVGFWDVTVDLKRCTFSFVKKQ